MNTKIIVTVGPSTSTAEVLNQIKNHNVDFIRVNMSHSDIDYLEHFLLLSKKIGLPFILDTEGSQIRTGKVHNNYINFQKGDIIKIHKEPIIGNRGQLHIRPHQIIDQLELDDKIHIDFDTLVAKVNDISSLSNGFITAEVVSSGFSRNDKAVTIKPKKDRRFKFDSALSEKDKESINLGLKHNVGYIAVSFVRKGEDIDEIRQATKNSMKIISKVECQDALDNIDDIINKSDLILLDRGDLSKEIPIEKIPEIQKWIIKKSKEKNTPVIIATNLLESMINSPRPTVAEINDISNTILDGAWGLTLAAETAIGQYPIECISTLKKTIDYTHSKLIKENSV